MENRKDPRTKSNIERSKKLKEPSEKNEKQVLSLLGACPQLPSLSGVHLLNSK